MKFELMSPEDRQGKICSRCGLPFAKYKVFSDEEEEMLCNKCLALSIGVIKESTEENVR